MYNVGHSWANDLKISLNAQKFHHTFCNILTLKSLLQALQYQTHCVRRKQPAELILHDLVICTWAGYCCILCVTAVVGTNSTVGTVCQPRLCPSTSYIAEEDGLSCSLIDREWLCDRWSCRERNKDQYLYSCNLLEPSETKLPSICCTTTKQLLTNKFTELSDSLSRERPEPLLVSKNVQICTLSAYLT